MQISHLTSWVQMRGRNLHNYSTLLQMRLNRIKNARRLNSATSFSKLLLVSDDKVSCVPHLTNPELVRLKERLDIIASFLQKRLDPKFSS